MFDIYIILIKGWNALYAYMYRVFLWYGALLLEIPGIQLLSAKISESC